MLTSEDHRQIAERCIRLAKTCTELRVAEQLLTFAANHLEKAELALRSPASVLLEQHSQRRALTVSVGIGESSAAAAEGPWRTPDRTHLQALSQIAAPR